MSVQTSYKGRYNKTNSKGRSDAVSPVAAVQVDVKQ